MKFLAMWEKVIGRGVRELIAEKIISRFAKSRLYDIDLPAFDPQHKIH